MSTLDPCNTCSENTYPDQSSINLASPRPLRRTHHRRPTSLLLEPPDPLNKCHEHRERSYLFIDRARNLPLQPTHYVVGVAQADIHSNDLFGSVIYELEVFRLPGSRAQMGVVRVFPCETSSCGVTFSGGCVRGDGILVAVGAEDAVAADTSHVFLIGCGTIRWTINGDGEIFLRM